MGHKTLLAIIPLTLSIFFGIYHQTIEGYGGGGRMGGYDIESHYAIKVVSDKILSGLSSVIYWQGDI